MNNIDQMTDKNLLQYSATLIDSVALSQWCPVELSGQLKAVAKRLAEVKLNDGFYCDVCGVELECPDADIHESNGDESEKDE